MKETIRRLNMEYGFNLTEEEIDRVAKDADEANRLFQKLYGVDLTGIMPMMKVDKGAAR